ncbi:MAG TPA: sulfatase-like hydrolase/transferase [Terriglobales bacterium]|nr:sulfatase-like hydrolase/transferase [Terriglobales bacterium]
MFRWALEKFSGFRLGALVLLSFSPVWARAAGKPNIVLITLESTRADRMGFLGAQTKISPKLDDLAGQSVIFERAFAQAPLTAVSHATILSGTYPQAHRAGEFGSRLATSLPFVPDLLRAAGYRTAAFVGSIALDPKNGFAPGFDRGFGVYDAGFHQGERRQCGVNSAERAGAQVVARANAWLAHHPKGPFFLWVHLNDPAAAPGSSYNAAVGVADAAAGKLVANLRTSKLYEDGLIVIASDHGQGLGAHGEQTHGVFLYDETLHVPLLLKLPQNQAAGKRVRVHARLVDIAPTILEIAGVTIPSQMQGQSLLRIAKANASADQPVYSMTDFPQRAFGWSALESWRTGKFLYIRAPRPELYDLSGDPGAARNLAESSKATLETIASQLDAFDRRFSDPGNAAVGGPELTSSEMQKLASLGYVGLQKPAGDARAAVGGVDPKDGIALANKVLSASAMLDEGKPEKAVAALQPLMATVSKMYLAQYLMGVALARQGQYRQAIERLRAAIELQPESAWAHYEMGSSLLRNGDFKTAVIHLEIAASRLPDNPGVHARLAEAYEHVGKAK